MSAGVWTDQRIRFLREATMPTTPLLATLNRLPGRPIASLQAVRHMVVRCDVARRYTGRPKQSPAQVADQAAPPACVAPSAPAPESGHPSPGLWTAERVAALRAAWHTDVSPTALAEQLDAMPGMRGINRHHVIGKGSSLNLGPRNCLVAPLPPAVPCEPVEADRLTIVGWARRQRLAAPTLAEINALRVRLGLPPFRLTRHLLGRIFEAAS